jgi:threonine/homoserine/homoserine lactone efflux protein
MIPLDRLLPFLGASVLVTLAPGPDILYVLTRGMSEGRKVALAAAAGFALGNVVHTTLAAAGLSALIVTAPGVFRAIQYAGAAYLVYLGVQIWRDRSRFELDVESNGRRAAEVFRQSILANVLNPKVAIFFLSFLPLFVDPARGSVPPQFAVLGGIFTVQVMVCFALVAWTAGWVGEKLRRYAAVRNGLRIAAGSVLILLGLLLAVAEPLKTRG